MKKIGGFGEKGNHPFDNSRIRLVKFPVWVNELRKRKMMEIELRRRAASGTEKAEIRGLDIADGLQLSHEAEKKFDLEQEYANFGTPANGFGLGFGHGFRSGALDGSNVHDTVTYGFGHTVDDRFGHSASLIHSAAIDNVGVLDLEALESAYCMNRGPNMYRPATLRE